MLRQSVGERCQNSELNSAEAKKIGVLKVGKARGTVPKEVSPFVFAKGT